MNSMRFALTSAALCAVLLAACDKAKEPAGKSISTAPAAAPLPTPQMSTTAPAKSKDTLPPVQGQIDTKEPAQRRDFETKR